MKSNTFRRGITIIILCILITPSVFGSINDFFCQQEREECYDEVNAGTLYVARFLDALERIKKATCTSKYNTCRNNWPDWLEWIPGCKRKLNKCNKAATEFVNELRLAALLTDQEMRDACDDSYEDCIRDDSFEGPVSH